MSRGDLCGTCSAHAMADPQVQTFLAFEPFFYLSAVTTVFRCVEHPLAFCEIGEDVSFASRRFP